jgi:hypothetical protein
MSVESFFQAKLIRKLSRLFPGCYILKNDPNYMQGFPDLTIFFKDKWAVLEVKRTADSIHEPNQDFYVADLNRMSFAAFIFPENEEEVLHDLQQAFEPGRPARILKR